jgi:release factor glutamine methyltransferase
LGITAKLELPNLNVTLSDISHSALLVARRNAKLLKSDVKITSSNLLTNLPPNPDLIIANLPYVDSSWMRSPETNFEPKIALFADEGGLEIIQKLIDQASTKIAPSGYLLLEADPAQHEQIHQYSLKKQFVLIKTIDYVVILQKA